MRPSGVRARILCLASRSVATALRMSVMIEPGPMALTRMPWGASASAITLVSWSMPPFDTQ